MISESTQAAMDRVMEQLNSQGLFNIIESTDDNPYNFTNLNCNTEGINNEENLDDVVQETPRDTIPDSQDIRGEKGMDVNQSITISKNETGILSRGKSWTTSSYSRYHSGQCNNLIHSSRPSIV